MTTEQRCMVDAVKQHATLNYEKDGWDYVVECFEDEDILEAIGNAKTTRDAIQCVGRIVKLQDEVRKDIQGEVF